MSERSITNCLLEIELELMPTEDVRREWFSNTDQGPVPHRLFMPPDINIIAEWLSTILSENPTLEYVFLAMSSPVFRHGGVDDYRLIWSVTITLLDDSDLEERNRAETDNTSDNVKHDDANVNAPNAITLEVCDERGTFRIQRELYPEMMEALYEKLVYEIEDDMEV
jgi:hypothetical protein